MATVERREQTPGRVSYRVRWWADGKQRSKSFDRADEARRFKAVLEGDTANGTWIDPKAGQQTVRAFSTALLDSIHDLRPTSKAILTSCLTQHVLPEFGNLTLSGVTHAHVQQWTNGQVRKHSASLTRKNVFALRRVMESAKRQGLVKNNPCDNISLPVAKASEQRFLSHAEIQALADTIKPRYRAMVLVAAYGGLRFGELCALRRKDVNVLKGNVRVRETLIDVHNRISFGPPKTKASLRTVTLPNSVMQELVAHLECNVPNDPEALLFTFDSGKPIRRAWFRTRVWLPAVAKADLEGLRFHDLRHTFVSLWISLGRNPKEVSKVAGHSTVAFTLDRYGHLYDRDESGTGSALDALLTASTAS